MKFRYLLTVITLFFATQAMAAKPATVDTTFTVDGICGMCKDRIENALSVKGIKMAEWSVETHELHVIYNSDKITINEIGDLLNAVGHDSDISKASDEEYDAIHGCCKYRTSEPGDCSSTSNTSTSSCSSGKSCSEGSKDCKKTEASSSEKKSCCSSSCTTTTTTTTSDSTTVSKSCCKDASSCKDKEKK